MVDEILTTDNIVDEAQDERDVVGRGWEALRDGLIDQPLDAEYGLVAQVG